MDPCFVAKQTSRHFSVNTRFEVTLEPVLLSASSTCLKHTNYALHHAAVKKHLMPQKMPLCKRNLACENDVCVISSSDWCGVLELLDCGGVAKR